MDRPVRKSKLLSKVLRHQPELAGVTPDGNGWIPTVELLAGLERLGEPMTLEELVEVVTTNNKQRFAFNEDRSMIRANQGHSIDVDLGLPNQEPPSLLYHGTAKKNLESITRNGLQKRLRHDVHLHTDRAVAKQVGGRHGLPVILRIDANAMAKDGITFRCSANGVWLTAAVPPQYIEVDNE